MRYLVGSMCVLALLASPLGASAQTEKEGSSRLERWHPEAFVDPSKPEPSLELELDSSGLEVTPAALPTPEERRRQEANQRKKRNVGIAVGVILIVGVVVGVAAGASVSQLRKSF